MGELADRRIQTKERIQTLKDRLGDAERIAAGKACVYAIGSFGREEASSHSDLDLFIVGKKDGKPGRDHREGSLLKRLDEICIKADLIQVTRDLTIPEFSGDGHYLDHFSVHDFTKTLGTPEDDVTNTFTARLLMLLESRPLLEAGVYWEVMEEVVAAYWRDYEDHKKNFMPAFLANDILRLWRTFCVNYEARSERQPDDKKAKGKIKNYKLKHSRMLTCYSSILYLLALFRLKNTVSPLDALGMIRRTPTERLEWLLEQNELNQAHEILRTLYRQYEEFLEATNSSEDALIELFKDKQTGREYITKAYLFGDTLFEVLNAIGGGNRFHRLLVV